MKIFKLLGAALICWSWTISTLCAIGVGVDIDGVEAGVWTGPGYYNGTYYDNEDDYYYYGDGSGYYYDGYWHGDGDGYRRGYRRGGHGDGGHHGGGHGGGDGHHR